MIEPGTRGTYRIGTDSYDAVVSRISSSGRTIQVDLDPEVFPAALRSRRFTKRPDGRYILEGSTTGQLCFPRTATFSDPRFSTTD